MDGVTHVLHRTAPPHDDGVGKVGGRARLLGVDAQHGEFFPQPFQEVVQVQHQPATDENIYFIIDRFGQASY